MTNDHVANSKIVLIGSLILLLFLLICILFPNAVKAQTQVYRNKAITTQAGTFNAVTQACDGGKVNEVLILIV